MCSVRKGSQKWDDKFLQSFIHSFTLSNTQEREKSLIFQTLSFPIFFSVVSSNTDYSHHHHARACILCLIFHQPTSTISINLYEDGKCSNIGRPLKMYASSQIYFNFFHYFCKLFEGNKVNLWLTSYSSVSSCSLAGAS